MTTCWSYGGGVQSAALGVLIRRGTLPVPDHAVIADTGREATSTWEYLDEVMAPYLQPAGVTIERLPHTLAAVDVFGHNGDCLIPAFTRSGKLPTFCSNEWKKRVVERYLRGRGVEAADLWLGISVDELERARVGGRPKWLVRRYPLIEQRMTRADCLALIAEVGLPVPERSACWMCPHRTTREWRRLRDRYPQDFQMAVVFEETLAERDPDLYLHDSRSRLRGARLDPEDTGQLSLCESGFCWT